MKKIASDLLLGIAALVVYNGIIQIVIYPKLQKSLGTDGFGDFLFWMAVLALIGTAVGMGANYSRMLAKAKGRVVAGDYKVILAIPAVMSCFIITLVALNRNETAKDVILLCLLAVLMITRYYSDVHFRLKVNYPGYFMFYLSMALGYCVGLLLYAVTGAWQIVFIVGESVAIISCFILCKEQINWYIIPGRMFGDNIRSTIPLMFSNLISSGMIQLDRIILSEVTTGEAVSIFYAATLTGKIMAMVSVPLNSIIISYVAEYIKQLKRKTFCVITAGLIGLIFIVSVIGVLCSHIILPVLYPDIFEQAKSVLWIANLGQAIFFAAGVNQTVILRFSKESLQMSINLICIILLIVIGIIMSVCQGYIGMAIALIIVNSFRFILTFIMGLRAVGQGKE